MANTYTWSYPQLDTAPTEGDLSDVIKTIHWRITAVSDSEQDADNNYLSVSMYGTTGVEVDDDADFIAFDSLTEDFVLHWVWHNIDKDAVEAALNERINAIKNPVTVAGVPW